MQELQFFRTYYTFNIPMYRLLYSIKEKSFNTISGQTKKCKFRMSFNSNYCPIYPWKKYNLPLNTLSPGIVIFFGIFLRTSGINKLTIYICVCVCRRGIHFNYKSLSYTITNKKYVQWSLQWTALYYFHEQGHGSWLILLTDFSVELDNLSFLFLYESNCIIKF